MFAITSHPRDQDTLELSEYHRGILLRKEIEEIIVEEHVKCVSGILELVGVSHRKSVRGNTGLLRLPSRAIQHLLREVDTVVPTVGVRGEDLFECETRADRNLEHRLPVSDSSELKTAAPSLRFCKPAPEIVDRRDRPVDLSNTGAVQPSVQAPTASRRHHLRPPVTGLRAHPFDPTSCSTRIKISSRIWRTASIGLHFGSSSDQSSRRGRGTTGHSSPQPMVTRSVALRARSLLRLCLREIDTHLPHRGKHFRMDMRTGPRPRREGRCLRGIGEPVEPGRSHLGPGPPRTEVCSSEAFLENELWLPCSSRGRPASVKNNLGEPTQTLHRIARADPSRDNHAVDAGLLPVTDVIARRDSAARCDRERFLAAAKLHTQFPDPSERRLDRFGSVK